MDDLLQKTKLNRIAFMVIAIIGLIYTGFVWFVSDITRAGLIDRFFLYYVDDIFRYCYVKSSAFNPVIFLNFSMKIGYILVAFLFHNILPFGMSSLRIMNVLFSCGTLFLTYLLSQRLSLSRAASCAAIIMTASFPVYFLSSLSTISEPMYSFFIMLAIYLLYSQKPKSSLFIISILPLFRQEGLLYILIWIFFFHRKYKITCLLFLFLPTMFWIFSNILLLNHSFVNLFFYLPVKDPPNSMASSRQLFNLICILSYHPITILSLIGAIMARHNRQYNKLSSCFAAHLLFLIIFQVLHFLTSPNLFCREIRLLLPLVPIMAIYAASALDRSADKCRLHKNLVMSGVGVISIIFLPFQISKLQRDPMVITDTVTVKQEDTIKETSIWLNDYILKNNIKKMCVVPGGLTTDKIIRRLWMYLPGYIEFYADEGEEKPSVRLDNKVFDMASFKTTHLPDRTRCLFISKEALNKNAFRRPDHVSLIKTVPYLHLWFYLVST